MGAVLRHGASLERGIQASIVVAVVGSVLAAGSVLSLVSTGKLLRWAALGVLVVLAVTHALPLSRSARRLRPGLVAAASFLALALASTAWSAFPGLTLARSVALGVVLVAAVALAVAASSSDSALETTADGIVAAVALVAVGGLILLGLDHDRAVDPATTTSPDRYQGLGGGPNTASMVLAVAFPLALDATLRRSGVVTAAIAVLVAGSIVASGSRGAILAALAGALLYALLRPRTGRGRLLGGAATLAGAGLAALLLALPDPLPPGSSNEERGYVPSDPRPAQISPTPPYGDANVLLRLQDDVGHPGLGRPDPNEGGRTLLGSSGRTEAWRGALEQAVERPVAGHGFGTEPRVFSDRYLFFNSGVPENSYIGLFLQLGAVGLLAFGVLAAALLVVALKGLRAVDNRRRGLVAACAGAFAGGLVLALFQSYVYAAGNNATLVLWISGFLAVGATATVD